MDQIAASVREWGWTVPVLIGEDGGIIAGHGRVLAAQKLGLVDVPTMVARGWTEAQRRAYVLADNKLALNAGWDDDMLTMELGDIREDGFDLGTVGFGEAELSRLLGEAGSGDTSPQLGDGLKYQIIVECADEANQAATLDRLKADGLTCRPLIL